MAQHIAPPTITSAPRRSTEPSPNGSNRKASPAKPIPMPTYASTGNRFAERNTVEERHPDRDGSDEEGSDTGRDGLLRPRERSMPGHEQEAAEDERCDDLPASDPVAAAITARQRKGEKHTAGDEVSNGHREKRWEIADRDGERDEGRSPDEIHRHEGEPDPHAVSRFHQRIVPSMSDRLKSS